MSFAALYIKKVTSGGNRSKSTDCAPVVKNKIILVTVQRMPIREVVASVLQFSFALAEKDALVPFSNASRRALSEPQYHLPIWIPEFLVLVYGNSRMT